MKDWEQSGISAQRLEISLWTLYDWRRRELSFFFSPTFRGLTRHTKKLFRVIETILAFGGSFVSHNYLIAPEVVCRRDPLLAPVHSARDQMAQLADDTGLSPVHRDALGSISLQTRAA